MSNFMHLLSRPLYLLLLISFVLTGCSSERTIVNNLEEREANEILVFLANKGIQASKSAAADAGGGGGQKLILYDINVPSDKATQAMALLNMAGLPRRRGQSLLGIFSGGGLVPSQLEEKIRYQQGLAQDIANTIRKIDGVLDADVQLSFPEEDPLNPEKNIDHVTASVYVKHNGVLDDPNAHLVTKIRRLVASSIPGLRFDNVTVIGDRARFTNITQDTQGSANDRQVVSVWSILVAKESVKRFQIIFFTFLILISLLLVLLAWMLWKFFHLIERAGGFSALFSLQPFKIEDVSAETPAEEPTENAEKSEAGGDAASSELAQETPPETPPKTGP